MKDCSPALDAHIQQRQTTLALGVEIVRADDTILGLTDHDEDVVVDGVTYHALPGALRTAIEGSDKLNVDGGEVETLIDSDLLTDDDILSGRYDHAKIRQFLFNWADPSMGKIKLPGSGWLGEAERQGKRFKTEFRGLMEALSQEIGRVESPDCDADLFDARCKLIGIPDLWTGTTAKAAGAIVRPTVYNNRRFVANNAGTSGGSEPAWNLTGTTNDGSLVWTAEEEVLWTPGKVGTVIDPYRIFTASNSVGSFQTQTVVPVPLWQEKRKYFAGQSVRPTTPNGFRYICTIGGLSGKTEPTFPTTLLALVTDKECEWQAVQDQWYRGGRLVFTSGPNARKDLGFEVKVYTASSLTFELWEQVSFPISINDQFTVEAGCDKTFPICIYKLFNRLNFRGTPFVPGPDRTLDTPEAQVH